MGVAARQASEGQTSSVVGLRWIQAPHVTAVVQGTPTTDAELVPGG
jgi:hypothetical protein